MRYYKLLYSTVLAALAICSCTSKDEPEPVIPKPEEPSNVDITVDINLTPVTKTSWSVTAEDALKTAWESDDQVSAYQDGIVSALCLQGAGGGETGRFGGRMDDAFKDLSVVWFCYPAVGADGRFDLSSQDGTIEGLANADCLTAYGLYDKYTASIDGGESVTMTRNVAVVHFGTIGCAGAGGSRVKTLTLSGSVIGNAASFFGGSMSAVEQGDVSAAIDAVPDGDKLSDVWMTFFPKGSIWSSTATLSAQLEDGRVLSGEVAFGEVPQKGAVYETDATLEDINARHGLDFYMGGALDDSEDANFLHKAALWKNGELIRPSTTVSNWQAIKDIDTDGEDVYFLRSYYPTKSCRLTYYTGLTASEVHYVYRNSFSMPLYKISSSKPLLTINTMSVDGGTVWLGGMTSSTASDGSTTSMVPASYMRATVWENGEERQLETSMSGVMASIVIGHKVYYGGYTSRRGVSAYSGNQTSYEIATIWDAEGNSFIVGNPNNDNVARKSIIYGLTLSPDGGTLYAAGQENLGSGYSSADKACVWAIPVNTLDGTWGNYIGAYAQKTALDTTGRGQSIASCVTISGDDVYAAGSWQPTSLNVDFPAIWKNGSQLADLQYQGYIRGIDSHDGQVTAVGRLYHFGGGATRFDISADDKVSLTSHGEIYGELFCAKFHEY